MYRAETCSFSLCNKFYTYLYHHIVALDKYIHSNLDKHLSLIFLKECYWLLPVLEELFNKLYYLSVSK